MPQFFDLVPDNNETDLAALYEDGSMVIYHDQLLGHYQAQPLSQRIVGGSALQARDINNDGWTDLIAMSSAGCACSLMIMASCWMAPLVLRKRSHGPRRSRQSITG